MANLDVKGMSEVPAARLLVISFEAEQDRIKVSVIFYCCRVNRRWWMGVSLLFAQGISAGAISWEQRTLSRYIHGCLNQKHNRWTKNLSSKANLPARNYLQGLVWCKFGHVTCQD